MGQTIYPPAEDRHDHALGGSGSVPLGTLRQCDCGRWFVTKDVYVGHGSSTVWQPVSWWNFRSKRRIRRWT